MPSNFRNGFAPPKWIDGKECHNCGMGFSLFARQILNDEVKTKHHCRYCGYTFCGICSNAKLRLPELGYFNSVRVCLKCFYHLSRRSKEKPLYSIERKSLKCEQSDCIIERRCSWSSEKVTEPSAPPLLEYDFATSLTTWQSDLSESERKKSEEEMQKLLTIFMARLCGDKDRGRTLATDSAANTMFVTLRCYLPILHDAMRKVEEERERLERMQNKLVDIFDSRAALATLREEYRLQREQQLQQQSRLQHQQVLSRVQKLRRDKQREMLRQSQETYQYVLDREAEMTKRREAERERLERLNIERQYPYSSSILPPPSFSGALLGEPSCAQTPVPPRPSNDGRSSPVCSSGRSSATDGSIPVGTGRPTSPSYVSDSSNIVHRMSSQDHLTYNSSTWYTQPIVAGAVHPSTLPSGTAGPISPLPVPIVQQPSVVIFDHHLSPPMYLATSSKFHSTSSIQSQSVNFSSVSLSPETNVKNPGEIGVQKRRRDKSV